MTSPSHERRQRRLRRWLDHDRRADRDRRSDLVRDQVEREVERRDREHDALRNPPDVGEPALGGLVGVEPHRLARPPTSLLGGDPEHRHGTTGLAARPQDRLAVLGTDQLRDLLQALGDRAADLRQRLGPDVDRQRGSIVAELVGSLDRLLDLLGAGPRRRTDQRAVIRAVDVEGLRAVNPLAGNHHRIRLRHRGDASPSEAGSVSRSCTTKSVRRDRSLPASIRGPMPTAYRVPMTDRLSGGPGLPQERRIVTEIPGPASKALHERKAKYVSDGIGVGLPVYVEAAGGGVIVDVDGNSLIDMAAGIAVTSVGNSAPEVVQPSAGAGRAVHPHLLHGGAVRALHRGLRTAHRADARRPRQEVGAAQLRRRGSRERRQDRPHAHRPQRRRRVRPRLPRPHQPDDGDDGQERALQARLRAVRRRGLPGADELPVPRAGRRSAGARRPIARSR